MTPIRLPPAALKARAVLADTGPLAVAALVEKLREADVVLSTSLATSLPDRYPDDFVLERGLIALPTQVAGSDDVPLESHAHPEAWWTLPVSQTPIAIDVVVVLDIETTGLDMAVDGVTQIGAFRFSDRTTFHVEVAPSVPAELAAALEALDIFLADAGAIAGHRLPQFDLPFLQAAAQRYGVHWSCTLPLLDSHFLSLLVLPDLASRRLSDLANALGVAHDRPHHAEGDALAKAAIIERLLDRYDPADAAWALAQRLLAEASEPWARVLPPGRVPEDLSFLEPAPDPLLSPSASDASWSTARAGATDGFRALESHGFRHRSGQRVMSDAVAEAFEAPGRLAVEAPTGTGKSLAYLLPAIGATGPKRPAVIATHTKALQHQLRNDAMMLHERGLMPVPFREIQGISNYFCTREIVETITTHDADGAEWIAVAVAVRGLGTVASGLWDDVTDGVVRRSNVQFARRRAALRATTDSCDRQHCDYIHQCPYFERLKDVDERPGVLAVNHALVGAWAALAEGGGRAPGNALGDGVASIVFDEAHVLEDSLTSIWTEATGAFDLSGLLGGILGRHGPVRRARQLFGDEAPESIRRLGQRAATGRALDRLGRAAAEYLQEFGGSEILAELRPGMVRSQPEFRHLANAAIDVVAALRELRDNLDGLDADLEREATETDAGAERTKVKRVRQRVQGGRNEVLQRIAVLDALRDPSEPHRYVYLLGCSHDGELDDAPLSLRWEFRLVPIDIGEQFRSRIVERARSVVLTSATLRVADSFDFIGSRLGCTIGEENGAFRPLVVDSPFDLDQQAAAILTSHLPLPVPGAEREFCEELAADQTGFLSLTGGKTLTLFAARKRMQQVAELVRVREDELEQRGVELLVQGEDSTSRLSEQFRHNEGAVLYGTKTFWEGFDAPGDTLSYLVIEKPPWPHPGDPIAAARQRVIVERGGDPFRDYSVPKTAIALAQGFGRLIRSETDRGAAIFCDRRMLAGTGPYQTLLDTLPTNTILDAADREDAWTQAIEFVTGAKPDLASALVLPDAGLATTIEALRIAVGEDPTAKLRLAAKEIFGIDELREEQLELMCALLDGKDALGFLPTGFGKSICFQLPALLHPHRRPTVVVSPLIALIKDQVDLLRAQKGLRSVRGITGRTTRAEREDTMRRLADGRVDLVYVSPERLVRDGALSAALARQELGAVVVDEAHCVSSWGHDFRPEFRQVVKPLLRFERSARAGFTATATPDVEVDLVQTLDLESPVVVRRGVDRPDLRYWAKEVGKERDRVRELLRFVASKGSEPGIVYASRRALTEELAWMLRQAGWTARAYHAGLLPEQRDNAQDEFLADVTQIVVATKAFGMGIDKPNIGWVVHYDLPESGEAYAQEAGRAARRRDLEGECVLFYTRGDIARRYRQAGKTQTDISKAPDLLRLIAAAPTRGAAHLLEPDETAEKLQIEPEHLNVLVAWLEQSGTLERQQDATTTAWVEVGRREPPDPNDRLNFVNLVKFHIRARTGTRRKIELDGLAAELGVDADDLEAKLVGWNLESLISFVPIRRLWRIDLRREQPDMRALEGIVARWSRQEQQRVDQIVSYARGHECRRVAIARVFGDVPEDCRTKGARLCDVCDGGAAPWHEVPMARVPDPENLVDVELVVMQAVRWSLRASDRGYDRRYGESSLRAALMGRETLGPHPLSPALFNCPQFGAVRYVRGSERRLDEAVDALLHKGALVREVSSYKGSEFRTLGLTDLGRSMLGGSRG
ncbi:MAG TPA: RecQ family ATP-dependent DNA helicase [Acidimicrobiia bacterium]